MLIIAFIWLSILLFKVSFTLFILNAPRKQTQRSFSDITVMQPILSGDPALECVLAENLKTLRDARFLWMIDTDDAEAARVTRRLQSRYTQNRIDICFFPQAPEGVNPKLFKLEQGRKLVESPIVLILDDDAVLSATSLNTMLNESCDNSLVTALPCYRAANSVPSRMLAQFVNDNSALTYLPLLPFARPLTLNGMCYLLPQQVLENVGGFSSIMRHLTDDLALATLLTKKDTRIIQSVASVSVQTSVVDFDHYFRQMHRWFVFATLLMREKNMKTNLAIIVLQGVHPLLLWTMVILAFTDMTNTGILVGTLFIRHVVLRRVQHSVSESIAARPFLSVLSELLQPVHLTHALLNRTIQWRSRRYRIYSNDRFSSL